MDQKEIAGILDKAAAQATVNNDWGATRKQCWFLAKLITDNETEPPKWLASDELSLTKQDASTKIDQYLNEEKATDDDEGEGEPF